MRDQRVVIHYVVGLALFGALNVFVLYFLGSRLFRSPAVGLVTALLWVSMPATMTYSNFAQDTVYGVFFNLALLFTWLSVTARRQSLLWAVILGLVFYALVMLNYSWCLAATVFAVFAFIMGLREHWSRRDILVRGILPLATMTLLAAATFIAYRLDYWTAYTVSSEYVREWYRFTGPRQWLTALVGGQVDLLLMAGSVVASAIVVSLAQLVATTTMIWSSRLGGPSTAGERGRLTRTPRRTSRGRSLLRQGFGGQAGGPSLPYRPEAVLLLVLLGVYAVPLLIGPTALKMETARCWSWVMSIPLAFAAATLLKQPGRTLFVCGAIAVSVATGTVMHLFLNFGP